MTLWLAVLAACLLAYITKLAGFSVPERLLAGPVTSRALALLPVALLAGLVAAQTFAGPGRSIAVDARAVGLVAAVVALLLRAPFLVVICVAAAVAAGLRALGWAA
jgi:branched-subunit amino acid transport protein